MAQSEHRPSRRNCLGKIGFGIAGLCLLPVVRAAAQSPDDRSLDAPRFRRYGIDQDRVAIVTATGHHTILVDISYDPGSSVSLLKGRRPIQPDEGILYAVTVVRRIALSNQGVAFPTDILFIAEDGRIVEIHPAILANDPRVFAAMIPVKAALQVLAGAVLRLDIVAGDVVLHQIFGRTI